MSTDILDQVRRVQPAAADLDAAWPSADRADLLHRLLLTQSAAPPRLRHRLVLVTALAAAAVTGVVAVPALLPDGTPGAASPAAAAALHRLSHTAAATRGTDPGTGQFLHRVVRAHQVGITENPGDPLDLVTVSESWQAPVGDLWRRDTGADGGAAPHRSTSYFPSRGFDRGAFLASLPTDAARLRRYLRSHVSGSNSTDEAVFVFIGDTLRDGGAPAALRSAMITVLTLTDHVTLGTTRRDEIGRAVEEFDYVDGARRPGVVQSLSFDPVTAELIDEATTGDGSSYTRSVQTSEVVDAVPTDVLRSAVAS